MTIKIERWKNGNPYDRITIGEEDIGVSQDKKYICNSCNFVLTVKIDDKTWYCNRCQIEVMPEIQDLRTDEDISVPQGPNTETLISTTPNPSYQGIRKGPKLECSFKALKDKGLKITNYREDKPK
jgi:hypothetical protein